MGDSTFTVWWRRGSHPFVIGNAPKHYAKLIINSLKTVTSRYIRKEYIEHLQKFYWKNVLWTRAYCLLTTAGAPLEVIRQYIEKQGVEKE